MKPIVVFNLFKFGHCLYDIRIYVNINDYIESVIT